MQNNEEKKRPQILLLSQQKELLYVCHAQIRSFFDIRVCSCIESLFSLYPLIRPAAILIDFSAVFAETEALYSLSQSIKNCPLVLIYANRKHPFRRIASQLDFCQSFFLPAQQSKLILFLKELRLSLHKAPLNADKSACLACPFSHIIGSSDEIICVKKQLAQAARHTIPIMLRGESGTGKTMFAHSIHRYSSRSEDPFVAVNMAAIADSLLESELFGSTRGSFTGAADRQGLLESAGSGTIFMDEIGCMSPHMQAALLTVLDTRSFFRLGSTREQHTNARFIFATNENLEKMVRDGTFRTDLYNRITAFPIEIPSLRKRRGDIFELTNYFLSGSDKILSTNALRQLSAYLWPGNVRELRHSLERACIIHEGPVIENLPI